MRKILISVVTGTLNRKHRLAGLIKNTVASCDKLELILVDGGSTDGTIEYCRKLKNDRIKFVEIGKRSPYPHYMNTGIRESVGEWICQWNDDVVLETGWNRIINGIKKGGDVFIFPWGQKRQNVTYYYNPPDEVVLNYGLYRREIFKKIGMYSHEYQYYCCDGDMSFRAWASGYKFEISKHTFVRLLSEEKRALWVEDDFVVYKKKLCEYRDNVFVGNIEMLAK